MIVIEGILFVLSSGLLFNERFRSNIFLIGIAGSLALVSSYLLIQQLAGPRASQQLMQQPTPAKSQQPGVGKWIINDPSPVPGGEDAIKNGAPYTEGCADLDDGTTHCTRYPTTMPGSSAGSSSQQ